MESQPAEYTDNPKQNSRAGDNSQQPRLVVGIGASAGGLEALQHFIMHLAPDSGLSYIIVQHLSPDYKSLMAELLAKHTSMEVRVAENDMAIEPDVVYVIPPKKYIVVQNHMLKLLDKDAGYQSPNTAIDIFLTSLAEEYKEKAVAIILSGTGSDGTKGIQEIKKGKGLVLVQNPATAKFDGMLTSAIDSGNIDLVLSPEVMYEALHNYLNGEGSSALAPEDENLPEAENKILEKIILQVKAVTGMDFTAYKRPTLSRRIIRRMNLSNSKDLNDYYHKLKQDPEEADILGKEFLINVTRFFRDKEGFDLLSEKVIPAILDKKEPDETVKIWVAGCSSGEEAYSIAILIRQYLNRTKQNLDIKIFATDADKEAINFASKGLYPETIAADVPEEYLSTFFIKEGNKYKVNAELRKMVIFAVHDIIKNPPYNKIDLLSCRNLLIYLSPELQRKTLSVIHFALNVDGYLFLGPSESCESIKENLEIVDKKWNIYRNVIQARNFSFEQLSGIAKPDYNRQSPRNILQKNYANIICDVLAESFGYGAVFINENNELLEGFGDYHNFLTLPKKGLHFNILRMVPEELCIALGTSIRNAVKKNERVQMSGIKVREGESVRTINLEVFPYLSENRFRQRFLIVVFTEAKTDKPSVLELALNPDISTREHLAELEQELNNTKQNLQAAIEQLEASNEELQSTNEELISANEELQSTNEELQSLNEELHTVNSEHQVKIKELIELNDDLNNYFRSTYIGQIFIDKNLIIRKFTPAAINQVNLIDSDIGRSITHISSNIKYDNLFRDIRTCIHERRVIEQEVESTNGSWYQMRIFPYVKQDQSVAGAVISFINITRLKTAYRDLQKAQERMKRFNEELEKRVEERTRELSQAKEELLHSNENLKHINTDLDNFVYTASHDLKAPIHNIEGLIQTLKEMIPQSEETKTILGMMDLSVQRFKSTLNDLTDITKIQKEVEEDIDENNLYDLIEEVSFNIRDVIEKAGAQIILDIKEPVIRFSKRNIRSIIYNLVSNAAKYSDPDKQPEITISSEKNEDYLILRVQDNGLGIPADKMDKLFGMFKRFHHHVEGTGIGLYIVKRIMDNSGGKIKVESKENHGTTFTLYFRQK